MTILMGLLLAAAFFDLWKRKIPNLLILGGAILGITGMISCREPFFTYLPGILIPLLIFFPFFMIGTLGAGDIKLFSMIGFFLPLKESMACIVLGLIIAVLVGSFRLIREGQLQARLIRPLEYLRDCLEAGEFRPYGLQTGNSMQEKGAESVSQALPTLIGTILVTGGVW